MELYDENLIKLIIQPIKYLDRISHRIIFSKQNHTTDIGIYVIIMLFSGILNYSI